MGNRRNFLKLSASLAATSSLPEAAVGKGAVDIPFSNKLPQELARDEAHWRAVRGLYPIQDEIINLEHGYWGKMSTSVEQALAQHTHRVNRDLSWYARRDYDRDFMAARTVVADTLGAKVNEVMLTRNATESFVNLITQYDGLSPGDAIAWADVDYPEFKRMMSWLANKRQVEGHMLALPSTGNDDDYVRAYEEAFNTYPQLKLVLLTHVSNQHGLVLPVRRIAALARQRGIQVICDCAQSWGLLDFTVDALNVDWAVFNLHKWIGSPVGIGALYMRQGTLGRVRPFPGEPEGDADVANRVHLATSDFAAFMTIPAAVSFHQAIGGANKAARLSYLRQVWTSRLRAVGAVELLGAGSDHNASGMGAFRFRGRTSKTDVTTLQQRLQNDFDIFTVVRNDLHSGSCIRVTPQIFTPVEHMHMLANAIIRIDRTS
ncbi:aminotransferase class V-fold PLP-dependent enzyme [Xanthomonas campestris]|uniref:aminotransferase class V-fold PLP-dependent enzyme n=1 Tax=Xanthomonas campestris TaxID=339 RepID=UPI00096FAFFC|nr:aminotransferase class V-fold PLP-dependent enzyme [Xanthomonas campestris]MCF8826457.1 aminotransferase class V-fold PLP-dependent enzyme [Xanthomonas campestris pv. raphani]MEA9838938.1 aminotransferase class V-fold PLP-dependent enzyme [Xanthomonas campestris pv. raphani]MEA9878472.1 aminotransferase class V-fold PLP-dependent enzyme [Xanthomonas campestris pv. raphani]MEA9894885.1 aminotransferase class V-fold PLP-dependent enzyme [Xanthomonas campestris pv. raphani]MEA9934533.1 aminotr